MNTHVDKTPANKPQASLNTAVQKQSYNISAFRFVNNSPNAIAQKKMQDVINNSSRLEGLRAYQGMANDSPRVAQLTAFQEMANNSSALQQHPIQKKENNTGLHDSLKSGIEHLSGYSMDDVKVHYNSDKPAQLQALAYAQGTDIHLAPGQEKHLPHEAWHVVQQKQGRVKPTIQMKEGINVNDDIGLEKEADEMGGKVLQQMNGNRNAGIVNKSVNNKTIQRQIDFSGTGAEFLPYLIDNFSMRSPYFKMAVNNPEINLTVHLKTGVAKNEKEKGSNGLTQAFMKCGRNTYYMGPGNDPGTLLKAAMDSKDYKNLTGMDIVVNIYQNPVEGVTKSFEAMMTTFAHEWELHIQPALQMYVLIKNRAKAKDSQEKGNVDQELAEHTALMMGGEDAEHAEMTSRFSLIVTLLKAMEAIDKGEEGKRMKMGFLEQVHNLHITPEELEEYEPELKEEGITTAEIWISVLKKK
ncbi:DUF4157 domain-containing protein [Chitinophaga sp. Ak27]|uniref:eCIS core domain-containing protein n=1 Tax=Chitinophaga sp. Ak27 TaxID=2726116 RepID=UPI002006E0EB|nr:DUF4157 domain-containing protein [Chitinophaga sp. Ak27]